MASYMINEDEEEEKSAGTLSYKMSELHYY